MKGSRTCIGCRRAFDKSSMLRMVKRPEGVVEIDFDGRAPGRGAYVCSSACMDKALEKGLFGRALRTSIPKVVVTNAAKAASGFFERSQIEGCKE